MTLANADIDRIPLKLWLSVGRKKLIKLNKFQKNEENDGLIFNFNSRNKMYSQVLVEIPGSKLVLSSLGLKENTK